MSEFTEKHNANVALKLSEFKEQYECLADRNPDLPEIAKMFYWFGVRGQLVNETTKVERRCDWCDLLIVTDTYFTSPTGYVYCSGVCQTIAHTPPPAPTSNGDFSPNNGEWPELLG